MRYACFIILICASFITYSQGDSYVTLNEKIKSNLFIEVEANTTDCFVGEPIIVTYKLFSALSSQSSILKNPLFIGFDVKSISDKTDKVASRKTIDGVTFDVHTILKLQLTPHKSGKLKLGALEMRHKIKLIDANGNKDPILKGVTEDYALNNGYYSIDIASVPITVLVTELPYSPKAPSFKGVVGDFKLDVQLSKKVFTPQERVALTVTIVGKGDFEKIKIPQIEWPKGIETLPHKISRDTIAPGMGSISFTIPFTAVKPGTYEIPSIPFSFFDASGYDYKTIKSIPVTFSVAQEGTSLPIHEYKESKSTLVNWVWAISILIGSLLIILLLVRTQKTKVASLDYNKRIYSKASATDLNVSKSLSVEDYLKPISDNMMQEDDRFYSNLKQSLIQFIEDRSGLSSVLFNEDALMNLMNTQGMDTSLQKEWLQLFDELNENIYSRKELHTDKQYLLEKAYQLLLKW